MPKRTDEFEELKKFWDEYSKEYDEAYYSVYGEEKFRAPPPEFHLEFQRMKRYLPSDKNIKILDAGGGTGRLTIPLARMGYHVTLYDISSGMLDVARRKLSREGLLDKVTIVEGNASDLPFDDETFDFIHWDVPIAEPELIRVLKKGGKFFFKYTSCRHPLPETVKERTDSKYPTFSAESFGFWNVVRGPEDFRKIFPENFRDIFDKNIKIITIYGWPDVMKFSEETKRAIKAGDEHAIEKWIELSEKRSFLERSPGYTLIGEKI
jgi:SAM-dependent methyltransferase